MSKYCAKCGEELVSENGACEGCGKKTNLIKPFMAIVLLTIIIVGFGFHQPNVDNPKYQESPKEFIKKVYGSKTCEEFFSYFSSEISDKLKEDGLQISDEECAGSYEDFFSGMTCEEIINKDELNLKYVKFDLDNSDYSYIVQCSTEADTKGYFFLNDNESGGSYTIVNSGEDIEEEVRKEQAKEEEKKKEMEILKNTSNPAYRIAPDEFIIDEKNIISELPEDGKSVWVEEVQDENTIIVSYIILKGGEQIITLAVVDIYGLSDLSGCQKEESVKFLKQLVEHKYVYLSRGFNSLPADEFPDMPKKFLLKYVDIWKEDIRMPSISEAYKDTPGVSVEVNTVMVYAGYGYYPIDAYKNKKYQLEGDLDFSGSYPGIKTPFAALGLKERFANLEEVAKVAKRGFWNEGVCSSVQ